MNSPVNRETLEALREGNHQAFEQVFITYYGKVKAFLFGYIKSVADAEELAQALFVNLWEKRQTIDPTKSFDAYLHTVARNAALNFLKHKYIADTYAAKERTETHSTTSEEDLIAKELGLHIDHIVEQMSPQRKQIYQLSREEGLNNQEIADQLNTSKRNVESQLSLALKEIRKGISLFFFLF